MKRFILGSVLFVAATVVVFNNTNQFLVFFGKLLAPDKAFALLTVCAFMNAGFFYLRRRHANPAS